MAREVAAAHLLVVDDNKVNRLLLGRGLEAQGHTVDFATNGREALAKLRSGAFDLLLLDIQMPEMDGYQVLEELARDLRLRDLPVIVTSALEELDSVVRCIEMGAEDYLTKPVNPVLLRARIGASLEKSGCATSSASWCASSPPPRWPPTWRRRGLRWAASMWRRRPCSRTFARSRPSPPRSRPTRPSSC